MKIADQALPVVSFESKSPLFLLGIARSGTTLLQSLLDGHPQLLVDVADSHFYRWYRRYYRWLDRLSTWSHGPEQRLAAAERFMLTHIFNEPSQYYQDFLAHISIPEIHAHFRRLVRASPARPQDYLEAYFHALGLASGCLTAQTRYWVDKTLSYEYLYYRYAQWWPQARFIFMVRDPRDIYASYKKRDLKNQRPVTAIDSFAYTWGRYVKVFLDLQKTIPAGQICLLKYEDLTAEPSAAMADIAGFLGIEMTPGLLQPTKGFGRVPWGGNAESGAKQFGVYQTAANKWAAILGAEEVCHLENLLEKEMEAVGYPLTAAVKKSAVLSGKLLARKALFSFLNLGL